MLEHVWSGANQGMIDCFKRVLEMEGTLLLVVEQTFQISKRGCVLAPGILDTKGGLPVRVGSRIRLITPDGQTIETYIRGFEMLNYGVRRPEKMYVPISLPSDIRKEQVPAGTKVVLVLGIND